MAKKTIELTDQQIELIEKKRKKASIARKKEMRDKVLHIMYSVVQSVVDYTAQNQQPQSAQYILGQMSKTIDNIVSFIKSEQAIVKIDKQAEKIQKKCISKDTFQSISLSNQSMKDVMYLKKYVKDFGSMTKPQADRLVRFSNSFSKGKK